MTEVADAIYNAACKGNGRIAGKGAYGRMAKGTTPAEARIDQIKANLRDVLVELPEGTTAGEILQELNDT